MSRMLVYPGFSLVFIQTFSVHHTKEFILPEEALAQKDTPFQAYNPGTGIFIEKADALQVPIAHVERDIENQIFFLPPGSFHEAPAGKKRSLFGKTRRTPMKGNVRRFSLRGFDFTMPIVPAEDESIYEATLQGHCNVEMNLFFGHCVSITYRFLFDGKACTLSRPVTTDHIIAFLSTWLSAEFWSREEEGDRTGIEYETHFRVDRIWLDEDGRPLEAPQCIDKLGNGRSFDSIALRYKNFIYSCCTQFKEDISGAQQRKLNQRWAQTPFNVHNDLHYAMVDIWENVQHPEADGSDLFSLERPHPLSEAQIVEHIREEHKNELIGLLSLYPEEWPYRAPDAYDEVCGENIAIDTDDLVLAGSSLCVVIGTYGRRGAGEKGVNWVEHLKERAHYHVSWPEYLLILQMILAKKYVIGLATDTVVLNSLNAEKKSSEELIGENAALSMRLTRLITQLDVVKYSKFPSHKVMFDRTTARLGLDEDYQRLDSLMEHMDGSLHNLSDYKSMKSEYRLNIILAIVSVASAFQLFFGGTQMEFVERFWPFDTGRLGAVIVLSVAALSIFAILYILAELVKKLLEKLRQ